MAKTTTPKAAVKSAKPATASKKAKASSSDIEKVCLDSLQKLQELGIEPQLQSDLEWCIGSYRSDNNPAGLYEMASRALTTFNAEKAKKTKGITAKLISDLEKAVTR